MVKWICEEKPMIRGDGATVGVYLEQEKELILCKDCKWYDEQISMCDNCGLPREQTYKCCVLNWLNEVYVTPSRAFNEYTDDELKMFAHDAIDLLKEQEPKIGHWILDPDGMDWNIPAWTCSECGGRHNGLPIMGGLNEANIYQFAGSQFCPNCGAKMSKEVKWDA